MVRAHRRQNQAFLLYLNPRHVALGVEIHEQPSRGPISQTGPRQQGQVRRGPAALQGFTVAGRGGPFSKKNPPLATGASSGGYTAK
jgi:hypothetical protein